MVALATTYTLYHVDKTSTWGFQGKKFQILNICNTEGGSKLKFGVAINYTIQMLFKYNFKIIKILKK